MRLEIHPGEGGDDALTFAGELGDAIERHTGAAAVTAGRIVTVEVPHRL